MLVMLFKVHRATKNRNMYMHCKFEMQCATRSSLSGYRKVRSARGVHA